VTERPVDSHDPADPVEILAVLPEGYRAQFLAEYTAAVEGAQRPEQLRQLRLRRLRAVAYPAPGMRSDWRSPVMARRWRALLTSRGARRTAATWAMEETQ
jgi:hypothetical protein